MTRFRSRFGAGPAPSGVGAATFPSTRSRLGVREGTGLVARSRSDDGRADAVSLLAFGLLTAGLLTGASRRSVFERFAAAFEGRASTGFSSLAASATCTLRAPRRTGAGDDGADGRLAAVAFG